MSDLGRTLRALPTLFRLGLIGALTYPGEVVIWVLATNTPLVMLALWRTVAEQGPLGRFDQRLFTGYFLLSIVVRLLTGSWVVYEINGDIRQGTLAVRLLKPIHPFLAYAVSGLSSLPLRLVVSAPVLLVAASVIGRDQLPLDPVRGGCALLAIGGAWLLSFSAMLVIGALGFFWESSVALWDLWFGLFVVFSGYIMPIELLPSWLLPVVRLSPFPYLLAFPVETLLGLSTRAQALQGLGIQWAYAGAVFALALLLWRRGVHHFAAYGG